MTASPPALPALYERARNALSLARSVDEVATIRNLALAQATYALLAKDTTMLEDAREIQLRAERCLGQMMAQQPKAPAGRPKIGLPQNPITAPTLAQAGIDKNLAHRARAAAAVPEEAFDDRIASARAQAARMVAKTDPTEKRAERKARESRLADKIKALPVKRYGVILADPEWQFTMYSKETGLDRAADAHYPTSSLDVIKARDVPSIAASDCVLFLWATAPMMPQALEVMAAWGFTYKTQAVWVKPNLGTGYWFRNRHELLLVGTRGNVPAPSPGDNWDSVIEAPTGTHSTKPAIVLRMIEALFPNLPKIELNRRGPAVKGWDAWGAEALDN